MPLAHSFNSNPLAIGLLIADRLRALGLGRADLVRRANYKNVAKGLRRLDELLAGELNRTRDLIDALPAALELPPHLVDNAIEKTQRQLAETKAAKEQALEAAWSAAFIPHAIILTERTVPQPIFVAAVIGVERLLRVDFDLALPPVSYVKHAIVGILRRLAEFRNKTGGILDELPAFGRPIGLIVNFTADRAVRFDLEGNALELLPRAYRPGDISILICGGPCPPETLQTIMLVG